uniref:Uncharacterized protein n=1 Tax=Pyrodinium bahamense TaxID=73915 RepID=A0A7S0AFD9_9DINO|mmetsp:Transcript_32730/g.90378  ORF Transcript_32730/g.90378 Transcript_32730/m.90378 type:complete len:837 (+) Transcript_32730:55-2565(+)|eukprot:CAMPEP_0179060658 /NCGR_PEP_ID=MMETSP0796-20121207/25979_1 /TAXON_ID=73915 /ORGANISM="Pyrodinium bahamense, Strain pbaha01" /LENGTH=836 /DNA_ID=CAMNT_0020757447 /DNA_START=55 /DNA_END=2565 /DNA_ORIENTATION=+
MKQDVGTPALLRFTTLLVVAWFAALCAGGRHRKIEEVSDQDPFGDLAPPEDQNPIVARASSGIRQMWTEAARVLSGVSLIDEQVELERSADLEVECAHGRDADPDSHRRLRTDYSSEQGEAELESKSVEHFTIARASSQCYELKVGKRYLPARFFTDAEADYVHVPAFPEVMGELVIEAVQHVGTGVSNRHHVVLELVGCTSCENDITESVEWGGLLQLDETGGYWKMYREGKLHYSDNFGKAHMRKGSRKPIVEMPPSQGPHGFPRSFAFESTPYKKQKHVKQYRYKYVSTFYDKHIEPKVRELGGVATSWSTHFNQDFANRKGDKTLTILKKIQSQARHVPFNHKMEQLHIHVYVCEEDDDDLACPDKPNETVIVHDGALTTSSSATVFFDELGRTSSRCTFGPCADKDAKHNGLLLNGVLYPYTMCSSCADRACARPRTAPDNSSVSLIQNTPENWFNCLVERTFTPTGYVDRLLQSREDTDPQAQEGSGLIYSGTESPGRIVGHINWRVTYLGRGHCQPLMQDAVYIGIGADEADKCRGLGGVDLDIGAVLLKCLHDKDSDRLGSPRWCQPLHQVHHAKYGDVKEHTEFRNMCGISADSKSGRHVGDDEWLYLRLSELAEIGVTHIAVTASIHGCGDGTMPSEGLTWNDLEGAFMRIAGSSGKAVDLPSAATSGLIDLDEMRVGTARGALVAMLYLTDDDKLAKPGLMERHDVARKDGKVWKVVSLQKPFVQHSMTEVVKHLTPLIKGLHELSLSEQVSQMDLDMALATGQTLPGLTGKLGILIDKALKQDEPHAGPDEANMQAMQSSRFWEHVSEVMPGGLPSADVPCTSV